MFVISANEHRTWSTERDEVAVFVGVVYGRGVTPAGAPVVHARVSSPAHADSASCFALVHGQVETGEPSDSLGRYRSLIGTSLGSGPYCVNIRVYRPSISGFPVFEHGAVRRLMACASIRHDDSSLLGTC